MVGASLVNIAANHLWVVQAWWALPPIGVFAFGWSVMVPAVTILALDLVPERRGMASSLLAVVGSAANGLVAGVLTPWVMHSTRALSLASFGLMCVGLGAWLVVRRRVLHADHGV